MRSSKQMMKSLRNEVTGDIDWNYIKVDGTRSFKSYIMISLIDEYMWEKDYTIDIVNSVVFKAFSKNNDIKIHVKV